MQKTLYQVDYTDLLRYIRNDILCDIQVAINVIKNAISKNYKK